MSDPGEKAKKGPARISRRENALVLVALAMFMVMVGFEAMKEFVLGEHTPWQSHAMTICFTVLVAVVISFFVINEFLKRNALLVQALAERERAEEELEKRVKELTCLYEIAQTASRPGISIEEVIQNIVVLLPLAWQYPEVAAARIVLDERSIKTRAFRDSGQKQAAEIVLNGARRGVVEVVYLEDRPRLYEGPFAEEERNLINAIAGQVALIIERREAEEARLKLEHQLAHADRLATIGLLAAGVAHELNEPLGGVLGFAQLVKKNPGVPESARQDIEKIEAASLHAREVIRSLVLFARETPPSKTSVNLNQVVEGGCNLFEGRCAKADIELVRSLSPNLPEIVADPAQMNQVFVNLVVNALQAMPKGGTLTIGTQVRGQHVRLTVEDTGVGMTEEVCEKVFVPFFTTKEFGEGTGLGLAVVHGIVNAHEGTIQVESQLGQGTRFEVTLPVMSA